MPGSLATSERHPNTEGQEVRDMELFLDLSESPFLSTSSAASEQQGDGSWSQDGDLQGCGQLERKWVLWHEFMKEHAHLDAWLRLAEQAVSSPNSAHVTCITAKEELRKFERLRCEAGSRLVQLDSLTQKNRTLTRLFQGAMQARLLALARECGQRWDNVNAKLESITRQLKLFVSEWEGFEAEREELTLWLADLDIRLTDVDHLTGNTCEKLRQLQVFEDDWILSQATDSGCPSETLLEEEGALDKASLDLPALSNHPKDSSQSANYTPAFSSPIHPPPQSSPTHEHQGLEWDPSVDIGRSVSRDDADSSYFSVSTGLCHRDGVKRRSYLSSLGSLSDISNDINNQEADLRLEGWLDHTQPSVFPPVTSQRGGTRTNRDQWATSTPDRQDGEPVSFDGGRVRAWLGVQSPGPPERRTSCSRAVQTDGQVEAEEEQSCCEEAERLLSEQSMTSSSRASSSLLCPALLYLLLAAALALLAYLIWVVLEPPCHRSSRMHRSFHLALRYVNGPPPT